MGSTHAPSSFSSLPKLSLSNNGTLLEKKDFAAAARVLFVLAIIKNKVFCQLMLGFQRDVSSDINARFTPAINTIKTLASNIMEKLITLEP